MGGEGGEKSVRKLEVKLKISEALLFIVVVGCSFLMITRTRFYFIQQKKKKEIIKNEAKK